ncbi:MAG TPA: hypothetical protein VJ489_00155 [Thermoplasmata archaeon]|nr:hypothetical protein [Thermoplasmata archaeon]
MQVKREGFDVFHEGDYIDVFMYSPSKELVGWFELASPLTRKLPPRMTIRWLELLATICGDIVVEKWKDMGPAQK